MVDCLGLPADLSSLENFTMRQRCDCDRSFRPFQRLSMGLRPFQRRGAYLLRGRSSKIPTLIVGVNINITITSINLNINVAPSYVSVSSSVGGWRHTDV